MWVWVWVFYGMYVNIRGQLLTVVSSLPPCKFQGLMSHQICSVGPFMCWVLTPAQPILLEWGTVFFFPRCSDVRNDETEVSFCASCGAVTLIPLLNYKLQLVSSERHPHTHTFLVPTMSFTSPVQWLYVFGCQSIAHPYHHQFTTEWSFFQRSQSPLEMAFILQSIPGARCVENSFHTDIMNKLACIVCIQLPHRYLVSII